MDNITGFGGSPDEISLGLNFDSNVGSTTNEFSTLQQVLQQIIKDEEAFKGIQTDSFEQAKALTQQVRETSSEGQQLISVFKALRGEQQGSLQDAKQLASVYQQMNNELQKAQQNKTRLGITSQGSSVPGSIPPTGGPGPIPGVPATQTGVGGGGGIRPPNTSSGAGFADEPDDFFGREESKSGAKKGISSGLDSPGFDPSDLYEENLTPGDLTNFGGIPGSGGGGTRPRIRRGSPSNEHYKQFSDLALTIFPGPGYYSRLRKARWLTRNEGKAINKFTQSPVGRRMGMALNRLGGGQNLRIDGGENGYQLFPFVQNDKGDYVDAQNVPIPGVDSSKPLYGLQNSEGGGWIPGAGSEGTPWNWNGEGSPPSLNLPNGTVPTPFDPWKRPNLNATGEGAAKIGGAIYAAKMIQAKGGNLFREGQLYTGITGGTGIAGALKYDLGAQATSWFGLNPLESYGQAKQINMQNLALGYRGNLLNQANSFGNSALQKYGVDPQTSMQMFGQMVMQAGASLGDLNTSLATLAHTASTTNTSFGQLQQNVVQYSQLGGSIGLTGGQNAAFATATAQFASGQPGLGATGANPADIMSSMIGQALVAQQMGTSYLGLPGASQQQGAGGVIKGEVKANEQLFNNMGITKSNYADSANYQRFKMVMASLGNTKEANLQYPQYLNYMRDLWSGKAQKNFIKSSKAAFAKDLGGTPGQSPGEAIAGAIGGPGGAPDQNTIAQDLQKIDRQQKWKNIGVTVGGKFMDLQKIDELPYAQRAALEAKIATGALPLSHINQHSKKVIQGNYASGTMLDKLGKAPDQFNMYGNNPNSGAMFKAETSRALTVELGYSAKKYLQLLEHPNGYNRTQDTNSKSNGAPPSTYGSHRAANPGITPHG